MLTRKDALVGWLCPLNPLDGEQDWRTLSSQTRLREAQGPAQHRPAGRTKARRSGLPRGSQERGLKSQNLGASSVMASFAVARFNK